MSLVYNELLGFRWTVNALPRERLIHQYKICSPEKNETQFDCSSPNKFEKFNVELLSNALVFIILIFLFIYLLICEAHLYMVLYEICRHILIPVRNT